MLEILARLGWSRKYFAERIGVSPDTVSRWKDDPPQLVMLYLELLDRLVNGVR